MIKRFWKNWKSKKYSDKIFDAYNLISMCIMLFVFVWPLWFLIIASFSDPLEVNGGRVFLWPRGINFESYAEMLLHKEIWIGYRNSLFYTVAGTIVNIVATIMCAYPLSRKDFWPRKILQYFFMFTMYFGGGLIPTYLVVKETGLIDSWLVSVLLGAMSVYNMLVLRSFFMTGLPDSLEEAATLDGANAAQYLIKVALPLSKPCLAVLSLYYALGHWNDWSTALIYISDSNKKPLMFVLRSLLFLKQTNEGAAGTVEEVMEKMRLQETLKYSTIIIASIPMLILYPFVQKYFVKGTMLGAIKG